MVPVLGFDTIIVHYRSYSDNNYIFELLYNIGIKNYIFLFDYDPRCDSISVMRYKANQFKKSVLASVRYKIKIKCVFNLVLTPGAAFNDNISRLYPNRKNQILFLSLPIFTDKHYDSIAHDINYLLYKRKIKVVFSDFDKLIETTSLDFCNKFINNPRISLLVDINYLFDPAKQKLFKSVLSADSNILLSISKDISNYVGVLASFNNVIEVHGRKNCYRLCSQINHTSMAFI